MKCPRRSGSVQPASRVVCEPRCLLAGPLWPVNIALRLPLVANVPALMVCVPSAFTNQTSYCLFLWGSGVGTMSWSPALLPLVSPLSHPPVWPTGRPTTRPQAGPLPRPWSQAFWPAISFRFWSSIEDGRSSTTWLPRIAQGFPTIPLFSSHCHWIW